MQETKGYVKSECKNRMVSESAQKRSVVIVDQMWAAIGASSAVMFKTIVEVIAIFLDHLL